MSARKRVFLLILIMTTISFMIEAVAVGLLYRAAFDEEKNRLEESAKSQARLIEAIANFKMKYGQNDFLDVEKATLSQIVDAHNNYEGFGETGEFTLSKRVGDKIEFLLSHRHYDHDNPKPVPLESSLAEPMRLALAGKSGNIIGLDYRGVKVLAAHEPVAILNWGIVAKIDMAEIRYPFIKAITISILLGMVIVALGASLFMRITNPIIDKLGKTIAELQRALENVKTLKGLLPICASCKNVRDDKGYWNQIESYISERSEAEFTHGLCPECSKKMHDELNNIKKS
jgi:hypothetical protein